MTNMPGREPRFPDRRTAGRMLAARLADDEWTAPVVLGVARGGVPVGYEIARRLRAPLGVQVICEIGAPGKPRLRVGAVTADGPPTYDERVLRAVDLGSGDLRARCERERVEARRRVALYERARKPIPIRGRDVIVCDDGLASGVTTRAALHGLRCHRPRTLVFAAPVCAPEPAELLLADADQVYCLAYTGPIGQLYHDTRQTTDRDVLTLLDAAARTLPPLSHRRR